MVIIQKRQILLPEEQISKEEEVENTNTHTHTYTYIYIYEYLHKSFCAVERQSWIQSSRCVFSFIILWEESVLGSS